MLTNPAIRIVTKQTLRKLAETQRSVQEYPKTLKGNPRIKVLYEHNPLFQKILRENLVNNLRNLSPGFSSGKSTVEQQLQVTSGGSGRGKAAYQAFYRDGDKGDKAAKIAVVWNRGGVISRSPKFLAQPLSFGKRIAVSPNEYPSDKGDPYVSFVIEKKYPASKNPNIKQDVHGLMIIRKRAQKSITTNKKGDRKKQSEIVASYLLLVSQTHKATHWADKALHKTNNEILPMLKTLVIGTMQKQKILS